MSRRRGRCSDRWDSSRRRCCAITSAIAEADCGICSCCRIQWRRTGASWRRLASKTLWLERFDALLDVAEHFAVLDRLGAVAGPELVEDRAGVLLDRMERERECFADLGIRGALGDERQYVALPT